ncbi:hypothetical protein POM88_022980 [Heracleum sosnowskyi]|uniref:Uncharacterized protein n=1 Tax=Heracleum sosnowskyi TaxID=360622 RepID=A0AAD8MQ34_9APIA|nr:hypothetical protein POM88_054428 [Heracleum sosnowskyi]KAK1352758.1 hypothetical protein POM88_053189 [Heracleum sosnowskyi]KAK1385245.1 hypothetical protein POM88_022980 [Heracleum sosnowskyi]
MHHSVLVNGVAFWLGSKPMDCRILVCFDTKTNTLREILLPDWVAYFVENYRAGRVDMWVLKGDSINEFFWEKKMNVGLTEDMKQMILLIRGIIGGAEAAYSQSAFKSKGLRHSQYNWPEECNSRSYEKNWDSLRGKDKDCVVFPKCRIEDEREANVDEDRGLCYDKQLALMENNNLLQTGIEEACLDAAESHLEPRPW